MACQSGKCPEKKQQSPIAVNKIVRVIPKPLNLGGVKIKDNGKS